jgi:acetyl-CoA carboxylase carboxyltransferase component
MKSSYYEASARERVAGILDADSFREILPPTLRIVSPHLEALDLPAAFDDGIVIGSGMLDGKPVLIAAQEGEFMGVPSARYKAPNWSGCWSVRCANARRSCCCCSKQAACVCRKRMQG